MRKGGGDKEGQSEEKEEVGKDGEGKGVGEEVRGREEGRI